MTRLRLGFPEPALFRTEIAVRIGDINYGNHLGHDALVSILHEARVRFFAALGLSESDAGGAGILLTELQVTYHAEVRHGETLAVEIAAGEPSTRSVDLHYRVHRRHDGALVARARTGILFFDYASRKVCRTPEPFAAALRALRANAKPTPPGS